MIDLHLHTTASDGRSTPALLVDQIRAAGIHTFSVADHDTVAAVAESASLAADAGLQFVPGIEVTAVHRGKDVHVLGYFFDPDSPDLLSFLAASCADRLRRAREMADKLAALGVPIDIDALIASTGGPVSGRSIARPVVARALVDRGHVADVQEAFDRYLAVDRPAYVARTGASPQDVVKIIRDAGGITSLAHPGATGVDELIPDLAEGGLVALECYHSEHGAGVTEKYLEIAKAHALLVSGGSDFHGAGARRSEFFGKVGLPQADFERLRARAVCTA